MALCRFLENVDKVRGQIAEFKQTRANPEKSALDLQNLTDTASEFVLTLLNPDGEARCSAQDALHLPWLKSAHKVKKPLTSKAVQGILSYGHKTLLEKKCMQIIATTLPDDDIKDLVNMFQTLDKNGDGEVSLSELKDAVDAASKRGKAKGSKRKDEVTDSDILKLMESIDSNGNQRISYTEFLAACLEERHYTQEAAFWHAFRHFDRNNDGCISKQELNEALREGDELGDLVSRQLIDDMMKQSDANGNQQIDYYEFMAMVQPNKEKEWHQFHALADHTGPPKLPPSPTKKRGKEALTTCPRCQQVRQIKDRGDKLGLLCAACWMSEM